MQSIWRENLINFKWKNFAFVVVYLVFLFSKASTLKTVFAQLLTSNWTKLDAIPVQDILMYLLNDKTPPQHHSKRAK